jgi:hypothetical protein
VTDRVEKTLVTSPANDEQKRLAFDYAFDARQQEISRFWNRTLVFWGFVTATFVAFGVLSDKEHPLQRDYLLPMVCFGLISSLAWTLQSRGSKYWLEQWEKKVTILEKEVLEFDLVGNLEVREQKKGLKAWWGSYPWSVTSLLIAVSDMAVLIWLLLLIKVYSKDCSEGLCAWFNSHLLSEITPERTVFATLLYAILIVGFAK